MMDVYLEDEEEEQDCENHVQLVVAVWFASEGNGHYEWDFEVEKRKQYQPRQSKHSLS